MGAIVEYNRKNIEELKFDSYYNEFSYRGLLYVNIYIECTTIVEIVSVLSTLQSMGYSKPSDEYVLLLGTEIFNAFDNSDDFYLIVKSYENEIGYVTGDLLSYGGTYLVMKSYDFTEYNTKTI